MQWILTTELTETMNAKLVFENLKTYSMRNLKNSFKKLPMNKYNF